MAPDGPDYEAKVLRCRACEAREASASRWQRDGNSNMAGAKFGVVQRNAD